MYQNWIANILIDTMYLISLMKFYKAINKVFISIFCKIYFWKTIKTLCLASTKLNFIVKINLVLLILFFYCLNFILLSLSLFETNIIKF